MRQLVSRRPGIVAAVLAGLVGLGVVGLASPASAHNYLVDSSPKEGQSLDEGPKTIELTFNDAVQGGQDVNQVAVLGPDDADGHWEAGKAEVNGPVVTVPVRELGAAGVYTVGYRILSADGHPVSGSLTFRLTNDGGGQPGPAIAPLSVGDTGAVRRDDGAGSGGGGLPIWVWIAGAAVLLGGGLVVALRMGTKAQ